MMEIENKKRERLVLYSRRSFEEEDAFGDDIINHVRSQPNPVMTLGHT